MIRPYGDHRNDGAVQLAFTLPLPAGGTASAAARNLAERMGLTNVDVVHIQPLGPSSTYAILYATCPFGVDADGLGDLDESVRVDRDDIEQMFQGSDLGTLVVLGASTGSDTHSVGIDAILNVKGYDGDAGLEAYSCFDVHNLGSQVPNGDLVAAAIELDADAVLVSQTVTQRDLHLHNLTELADLMEASGLRPRTLLVCGGPRIGPELAKELGFDASFGKGTRPTDVAHYIITETVKRQQASAAVAAIGR